MRFTNIKYKVAHARVAIGRWEKFKAWFGIKPPERISVSFWGETRDRATPGDVYGGVDNTAWRVTHIKIYPARVPTKAARTPKARMEMLEMVDPIYEKVVLKTLEEKFVYFYSTYIDDQANN